LGEDHIGIATLEPGETDSEALINNADKALYQMKDLGKGGFTFYDPNK
jgi:PleD family two-component response regulator